MPTPGRARTTTGRSNLSSTSSAGAPACAGARSSTTPLNPDPARFVRFCRALLDEGCDGLAPFGTTSEGNSLSLDERERLLDALLDSGLPPQKLIPGTGCCALPDTVRLSRKAARAGCAG